MTHRLALALLAVLIILPVSLWAHGNAVHVLGTVTEAADNHLVVKTPKGKTVSVTLHPKTIFRRNGITDQHARPNVGDRLIAEATKQGDALVATEINFSTPKSP